MRLQEFNPGVGKRGWFGAVLLLSLICPALCMGNVLYIDDDSSGGDGSSWATAYKYLQDALSAASEGDVVRVAQGVYKPDRSAAYPEGTGDPNVAFELVNGMTLKGGFAGITAIDPDAWDVQQYETILSGDLAGDDVPVNDPCDLRYEPTRIDNSYTVIKGEDLSEQIYLQGLTIAGGYATGFDQSGVRYFRATLYPEGCGGGMFLRQCSIRVDSCCFVGNWANLFGGGVGVGQSDILMDKCTFADNGTFSQGGGLYAEMGTTELQGCKLKGNRSIYGGGISTLSNNDIIRNCFFIQNRSSSRGGGASLNAGKSVFITCLFNANIANGAGGGLSSDAETEITSCQFVSNLGGAIYNGFNRGQLYTTDCLFIGNHGGGGAFGNRGPELIISNCTAHGNRDWTMSGRFLDCSFYEPPAAIQGRVLIHNCIIDNGNTEITNNSMSIEVHHSCIVGGLDSIQDEHFGTSCGSDNLDVDPCFADPGYWDANDTPNDPNDDFFVVGDYHLKSQAGRWDMNSETWVIDDVTSPCIDAGDPNSPIMYEPFPHGGLINMGVYGGSEEASKSYFGTESCEIIVAGDINGDCKVDFIDLCLLMGHWLETH